jgi:hypothetical protein
VTSPSSNLISSISACRRHSKTVLRPGSQPPSHPGGEDKHSEELSGGKDRGEVKGEVEVEDDALQRAREAEAIGHDDDAVLSYILGGNHRQVRGGGG